MLRTAAVIALSGRRMSNRWHRPGTARTEVSRHAAYLTTLFLRQTARCAVIKPFTPPATARHEFFIGVSP